MRQGKVSRIEEGTLMKVTVNTIILCMICGATTFAAEMDMDFVEGKLNGKDFDSYTIDSITDLLGRPSQGNTLGGHIILDYEDEGIKFQSEKGSEKIGMIIVYLVSTVEDYTKIGTGIKRYSKFRGKLPKGLNGNWKVEKFLESFKDLGAIDATKYNLVAKSRELGMDPGNFCSLKIPGLKYPVRVFYEDSTKFLNKLEIFVHTTMP